MKPVYVHGIECPKCHDRIWSRDRHDFRWCACGEVAIDGGREYFKVTYNKKVPKTVRIKIS